MKTWRLLHFWQLWVILVVLAIALPFAFVYSRLNPPPALVDERQRIESVLKKHYPTPLLAWPENGAQATNTEDQHPAVAVAEKVHEVFNSRPVRLRQTPEQKAVYADYLGPITSQLEQGFDTNLPQAQQRSIISASVHLLQIAEPGSTQSQQILDQISSAALSFDQSWPNITHMVDLRDNLLTVLLFHAEDATTSTALTAILQQVKSLPERVPISKNYLRPVALPAHKDEIVDSSSLLSTAIHNAGFVLAHTNETSNDGALNQLINQVRLSPNSGHQYVSGWTSSLLHKALFQKMMALPQMPTLEKLTGLSEFANATLDDQIAFYGRTLNMWLTHELYTKERVLHTYQHIVERWIAEKLFHLETGQWAQDAAVLHERYQLQHNSPPTKRLTPLTYPEMESTANTPFGSPKVETVPPDVRLVYNLLLADNLPQRPNAQREFEVSSSSPTTSGSTFFVRSLPKPNYYVTLATLSEAASLKVSFSLYGQALDGGGKLKMEPAAQREIVGIIVAEQLATASQQDPAFPVNSLIPETYSRGRTESRPTNQQSYPFLYAEIQLPNSLEVITYNTSGVLELSHLALESVPNYLPRLIHPRQYQELMNSVN